MVRNVSVPAYQPAERDAFRRVFRMKDTMTQILERPIDPQTIRTDYEAIKARQQATWASGDFSIIGTTLQIVGESLCEAADLDAGARVLDVACGNGNAALAAARRYCQVTGLDYVPALLDRARERSEAERLPVEFVVGDAEQLPFADASFDAALSTFGVMFAPDQERAARELSRVVRPGGTIALANWTPEGFVGQMLGAVTRRVPPPPGLTSPARWGTVSRLRELFPHARSMRAEPRDFVFRYESVEHFLDVFRRFYGPTLKAFAALSSPDQELLAEDLRILATRFSRGKNPRSTAIRAEYLEVVIGT